MTKAQWRVSLSRKRKNLPPSYIEEASISIANQVNQLNIWSYQNYHLFLSIPVKNEVNTDPLLHVLQGRDKNVIVSKSDFSTKEMQHYLLTDSTVIRPNKYGIPEPQDGIHLQPEQVDVVFVPLLGCDNKGNRIGYGGGFYDRFLARCRPDCLKIGLSFFPPLKEELPSEKTDVKLYMVVMPDGAMKF